MDETMAKLVNGLKMAVNGADAKAWAEAIVLYKRAFPPAKPSKKAEVQRG